MQQVDRHTLEWIHAALEDGFFKNHWIVFEGDSLTRQVFTSVACLAWGNGYMLSEETDWKKWMQEQYNWLNWHFPGFKRKGKHSMISCCEVQLKDGGHLIYRN